MPSSIGINLRVTGHCSQGGRKYMEDFFSIAYQQSEDEKDLEYAFFGIYDGHGGSEAATFAKEHLMKAIVSQKLFWSDSDQDILRAIREGYIATHYAMWREQEKWPKTSTGLPSTAGTTASVAFIRRGKIYIGHVGDSGIVLGYQEEGEKYWRAKALTHDHKPECNVEKARIISSGGKVITKSGVPRVVWNRPRIGHKGPVRRSTPIDEIPFLAVARSLGDLWSYNSALNEFVVSPDPDVKVVKIDPKNFRCLIFGTDGLWNVLSANEAVDLAFEAEIINERIALGGNPSDWTNPSKVLVDKALEQWSLRRMRADNTSVVTIMLDPPGPPKRDMIRSCPTASYGLEYTHSSAYNVLQPEFLTAMPNNYGIDDMVDDEILYEPTNHLHHLRNSNGDQMVIDGYSTNGYAVMTRYDDYDDCDSNGSDMMSNSSSSSSDVHSIVNSSSFNTQYMNSFAESYNSLLISSYENDDDSGEDEVDCFERLDTNSTLVETDNSQHSNQYQLHQYQQQCMDAGEGYSLTKLETRGEQQFNSMRSYSHRGANVSFQDFGEDVDYNQYNNISSSYQRHLMMMPSENVAVEINDDDDDDDINKDIFSLQSSTTAAVAAIQPVCKEKNYCEKSSILDDHAKSQEDLRMNCDSDAAIDFDFDESIQINEISSSIVDTSTQDLAAITLNNDVVIRKAKAVTTNRNMVVHSENKSLMEPRRLRSSILIAVDYNKRSLRSRNMLGKDLKAKSTNSRLPLKRSVARFIKSTVSNSPSLSLSSCSTNQQRSLVWSQRQQKKSTKALSSASTAVSQQTSSSISVQSAINGSHRSDQANCSSLKLRQSLVCSNNNKPKTNSTISRNSNFYATNKLSMTAKQQILAITSPLTTTASMSFDNSNSITSSQHSSTTSTRRTTSSSRNSAWCYPAAAIQTRNRVQKRNSH